MQNYTCDFQESASENNDINVYNTLKRKQIDIAHQICQPFFFNAVDGEGSPLNAIRLVARDFLYMPFVYTSATAYVAMECVTVTSLDF